MVSLAKNNRINALLVTFILLAGFASFGQKPIITSIDKVTGANQDIVTLRGTSFGGDPSKLTVYFGGAKGFVNFASDQLLEARVPSGATYDKISVTETVQGLTEY